MGKIKLIDIVKGENPAARHDEAVIYVDALMRYKEARENIEKNGYIVAHPRTGSPIDNPYIKVMDAAVRNMQSCKRVKDTERVWTAAEIAP